MFQEQAASLGHFWNKSDAEKAETGLCLENQSVQTTSLKLLLLPLYTRLMNFAATVCREDWL